MAVLEIATLPNPILRRKAHKISLIDKEMQKLVDDMVETMRQAPGVGLAAPQVSKSIRLIVVEYKENEEDDAEDAPRRLYVVINPEIVKRSDVVVTGAEGCLSVPNLAGEVERYKGVTVKGLNRYGKPIKIEAKDWLARIFQHEIDHLDGILFPDRAERVWEPGEGETVPD
jgi:peptide deformylase